MTISLTLTVEILLGKESDRHLLTSTPLLSEANPRVRRPQRPVSPRCWLGWGCCSCQRSGGQHGGEAARPDSITFIMTPPLHQALTCTRLCAGAGR